MAQTAIERRKKLFRARQIIDRMIGINEEAAQTERVFKQRGLPGPDIVESMDKILDAGGPPSWDENIQEADFSGDGVLDVAFTGNTLTDELFNLLMSDNETVNPIKWASTPTEEQAPRRVYLWSSTPRNLVFQSGQDNVKRLPYVVDDEQTYTYELDPDPPTGIRIISDRLVGIPLTASPLRRHRLSAVLNGEEVTSIHIFIEVKGAIIDRFRFNIEDITVPADDDDEFKFTNRILIDSAIPPTQILFSDALQMYVNGNAVPREQQVRHNDTIYFKVPVPSIDDRIGVYNVTIFGHRDVFTITKLVNAPPVIPAPDPMQPITPKDPPRVLPQTRYWNVDNIDVFSDREAQNIIVQGYMVGLDVPNEMVIKEINANGTDRTSSVLDFLYKVNDDNAFQTGDRFAVQNGDVFTISFRGLVADAEHIIKLTCGESIQTFTVHYRTDLNDQASGATVAYYESTVDVIKNGQANIDSPFTEEWFPSGASRGDVIIENASGYETFNRSLRSAADESADSNGYSVMGMLNYFAGVIPRLYGSRIVRKVTLSNGNIVDRAIRKLFIADPFANPNGASINPFDFGFRNVISGVEVLSDEINITGNYPCLLYTSPSPRDS